jgi:hypothetical protein
MGVESTSSGWSVIVSTAHTFLAKIGSGVHLTGSLSGWTTPKDLILHLAGKLTVKARMANLQHTLVVIVESRAGRGRS